MIDKQDQWLTHLGWEHNKIRMRLAELPNAALCMLAFALLGDEARDFIDACEHEPTHDEWLRLFDDAADMDEVEHALDELPLDIVSMLGSIVD